MNNTLFLEYQQTNIGRVGVAECEGFITRFLFESCPIPECAEMHETDLLREAFRQLNFYLAGELKDFSLPLALSGTPFLQQVWKIISTIPYGKTLTYKDIAARTGNPLAVRAVGMATHRNLLPLFIPCHRVIGSDGTLTGYRGGIGLKKQLLELEMFK
ncbi:MAG: methylated-DNA--[protein]-cysteine S-methyltransferase [Chlorobiaceae bacterium]|nr:methylated-DNA--[protein]-cysteine S-methyltransferase [Chlorobiaceae bacterium]